MSTIIRAFKVKLSPNNKQQSQMFRIAGYARYAYNWALATEESNYENGGKFINDYELRRMFTEHKQTELWLYEVSNNALKQSIKDACEAYRRFFRGQAKHPRFKSKKKTQPSFYMDVCKIEFTNTHVKLEKIADSKKANRAKANWVRLVEHRRIPVGAKYSNPRITFDGIDWWISVGVEMEVKQKQPDGDPIGIDVGIKSLAVCSDGVEYANINKTGIVKQDEKRHRRLQRQVSRKYQMNKKGVTYNKTSNIRKLEKRLLKSNKRLVNIRQNHLHQTTSSIIAREPSVVVMEDLNIKGMMNNKRLAKAVQQQSLYEFYRQMQYKCEWNNIVFITADRFYPSSKTCSHCGSIKKDLKLSDRTYACTYCGMIIDRDLNAAINLASLAKPNIAA